MGNKCLVTKYKSRAVSEDLLGISEMRVHNSLTSEGNNSQIYGYDGTATILEDGFFFTVISTGNKVKSFNLLNSEPVKMPAGNYTIQISDKYNLRILRGYVNAELTDIQYSRISTIEGVYGLIGDISVLKNMKELTVFETYGSDELVGDFNTLAQVPTLTKMTIVNCPKITGTIINYPSSFKKIWDANVDNSKGLINFKNTGVTGSIEELVASAKKAGHSSGFVNICLFQCKGVTFGIYDGNSFVNDSCMLKWDNDSIFYYLGQPDKFTTVIAKGASTSQISEWKSSGKNVFVVD